MAPTISPDQTNYNVIQGEAVTLTCLALGDPTPSISWFHDGRQAGDGRNDGSYQISDAVEADRGEWKCVATNPVGTAERAIRVSVHSMSTLIQMTTH